MSPIGYISRVNKFKIKNKDIGPVALEILQLFAYSDSLSTYEIFSTLKSTRLKTAYKNVHKKVQRLKSLDLIEDKQVHKGEHGAKYYGLSEEGIYQLFLKRVGGLIFNHLSNHKEGKAIFVARDFIRYHSDNALFETFLYPYFDKKTVSTANYELLSKFFSYLHDCCKEIESILSYSKRGIGSVPVIIEKFKWNSVGPGPDDEAFRSSVKEIFDLEDFDNTKIEKIDDITLQITTPHHVSVLIKLDRKKKKALATLDKFKRKKDYEYDVYELGSDLSICTTITAEESMKKELSNKKIIELPVYRLVSDLTKSEGEQEDDALRNLAEDDKFMRLVDNMHDEFDKGYNKLMKLSGRQK